MSTDIKTVIEITNTHIKVLRSRILRNQQEIMSCNIHSMETSTDGEIVKVLKEIFAARNMSDDEITLIVPRRQVILKHMRLPSLNEEEIRKMLGLQLVEQIPYAVEDIIYDFQIIEKEELGYTNVLGAVIHKEVSQRYIHLLKEVGVHLRRLTLSSLGILGGYRFCTDEKKEPILLINMDVAHTEICFCRGQKLVFSRSIDCGAKDFNSIQMLELIEQIKLSLKNYSVEKMGLDVQGIVLLSNLIESETLKESLEREVNLPVRIYSSVKDFPCEKNIDLVELERELNTSFVAIVGALFTDTARIMNFIPQEVHDTWKIKQKKNQWVALAIRIFIVVILGMSALGIQCVQKTIQLNGLEKKISEIKPIIQKAKKKRQLIAILDEEFMRRLFVPELIYELIELTPVEISFTTLSLDEKGYFDMHGYAQTGANINNFQALLVKSQVFNKVNLQFAKQKYLNKMDVTEFRITSELKARVVNN